MDSSGAYQAIPVDFNDYFSGTPTLPLTSEAGGIRGISREDLRKKLYLLGGIIGFLVVLLIIVLPIVDHKKHHHHQNHGNIIGILDASMEEVAAEHEALFLNLQEEEVEMSLKEDLTNNLFGRFVFYPDKGNDIGESEALELVDEVEFSEHFSEREATEQAEEDSLQSKDFYDDDIEQNYEEDVEFDTLEEEDTEKFGV